MKKTGLFLIIGLLCISCKQKISEKDIAKLNGYWEISTVILADGSDKDYKVNETIDFFNVDENKGFRQKVMPQLNGTYLTNGIKEKIVITNEDTGFFINYATAYGKWKEQIVEIKDSSLVLKNKENLEYHYKRATLFSIK